MGKNFTSVADSTALSGIPVSEYDEGALAYSLADRTYFSLRKNVPFNSPVTSGSVRPQDGSPVAGSPLAVWEKWQSGVFP